MQRGALILAAALAVAGAAHADSAVLAYRTEVPLFASLPVQLRQADVVMLANMHRRSGDNDANAQAVASVEPVAMTLSNERRAWARAIYSDLDIRQQGTVRPASQGSLTGLQAGTDVFASQTGDLRGGVYVGSLEGEPDVHGSASGLRRFVGDNDVRARYLGAYATYQNTTGWYADAVLQWGEHRYTAQPLGGAQVPGKGESLAAALELGQSFALGGGWTLEPQAQLIYRRARLDEASLLGARVRQNDHDGWITGLGLRVKGDFATSAGRLQPYARVGVQHAPSGNGTTRFIGPGASVDIASSAGYTSAEVAGGATLSLNRTVSLYGELGKLLDTAGDTELQSSLQGSMGLRVRW